MDVGKNVATYVLIIAKYLEKSKYRIIEDQLNKPQYIYINHYYIPSDPYSAMHFMGI